MTSVRALFLALLLAAMAATPFGPVLAQTEEPLDPAAAEPALEAQPKKKPKETNDLEARVAQLERQILDMQVVIGTLESMARGGGGQTAGLGSDAEARIAALETQLQALSAEVRSLGGQAVSSIGASSGASQTDAGDFAATTPEEQALGTGSDLTLDSAGTAPGSDDIADILQNGTGQSGDAGVSTGAVDPSASSDGTTASGDGIASSDLGTLDGTAPAAPATEGETEVAAVSPDATPEQVYEEAYGHLLQQDYAAAEGGFKGFLKAYPKSKLAGNAQYWLGETHYVRGNYKAAADAFLTGYKNFRKGQKAPDSLMKLAMSLSRLGEKDAACSAFAALESEFTKMQAQLRRRAEQERQRAGC